MRMKLIMATLAGLMACWASAMAQSPPAQSPAAQVPAAPGNTAGSAVGRELARRWCVACHVVEADGARGSDAAPSFPAIARRPATDNASLHAFLSQPHKPMPDPKLDAGQIDALAAYILSLK